MLSFHRHRRRRRSQKPGRSASGFSLIEVTAVVLVLAIITVPLASAWKMSLTVTAETGEILYANSNRDISSARWVADVASVDAAGVSYTEARACRRSSTSGTLLVTFNTSQVDANGNTQVRRTSYWLTGTGRDRSITRYECKGALGSLSLTNGRETDVAARIGVDGRSDAELVFPETGPGTPVCTEFVCTLNVNGSTYFELRGSRRVFGAGVPLEAGKLYSTAYTRYSGGNIPDRYRYYSYDLSGAAVDREIKFGNKVSLAPGLGEDVATKFKIKQA
ncbi:MAG TPA: hypothetical protein P5254_07715, partial [Aquihabitans sp.]|nr:hypothetical protein [Aquihabitans sp.]